MRDCYSISLLCVKLIIIGMKIERNFPSLIANQIQALTKYQIFNYMKK